MKILDTVVLTWSNLKLQRKFATPNIICLQILY
jgi:hypothetical protein